MMSRHNAILPLLVLLAACQDQHASTVRCTTPPKTTVGLATKPATTPPASTLEILESNRDKAHALTHWIEGDLTKDGIPERVEVWNTDAASDETGGFERELRILKQEGKGWRRWYTAPNAILPTYGGGVYGDPFEGLRIERGCLVISHYGGSSERWGYTDIFRWQKGDFYQIGHSSVSHTTFNPAASMVTTEENYSTGKAYRVSYALPKDYDTTGISEDSIDPEAYIPETTFYKVPKGATTTLRMMPSTFD